MSKVNRNHPCPCGSGKKYKKCCLNNQVPSLNLSPKDQQAFNELLPKVFDYSKKFDEKLQPIYQRYTASFHTINEKDAKAFSQIIFHWLLYNAPLIEKSEETILTRFIEENRNSYSSSFQPLLDRWKSLTPSLFLVSKDETTTVSLKDSLEATSIIPEKTSALGDLSDGDLLLGFTYPTPEGIVLGTDTLIVPENMKSLFYQGYERLTEFFKTEDESEKEFFVRHFPVFISLLSYILRENKEEYKEHSKTDKVINTLLSNINLMDYSYDSILDAEKKWNNYYSDKKPRIQKPAVFAATLEYWISKQPNQWTSPKQRELAEKYQVSAGVISARYKELTSPLSSEQSVRIPRG